MRTFRFACTNIFRDKREVFFKYAGFLFFLYIIRYIHFTTLLQSGTTVKTSRSLYEQINVSKLLREDGRKSVRYLQRMISVLYAFDKKSLPSHTQYTRDEYIRK